MQDSPTAPELLDAAITMLRDTLLNKLSGTPAFQLRVTINALELVARQLQLGDGFEAAERQRLADLLGQDGDLAELNTVLAKRIAESDFDGGDAALRVHLWATTLDKLAIDQPRYAAYLAEIGRN